MSLNAIYHTLNLNSSSGLCITANNKNWKGRLPQRLERLIVEKIKPEAFFCFENRPLILFYDSPTNKLEIFKKIWNFNETPIVIINQDDAIEIYNGFSYLKDKKTLEKLSETIADFSYFKLVTGRSFIAYKTKFKQQQRVDTFLLKNIKATRNILIQEHKISGALANAIIGKCIFVRYLIDREVNIKFENESTILTNNTFCDLLENEDNTRLIMFFKYLQKKFNGEAFLINNDALRKIPNKAFSVLGNLLSGAEISTGQKSLFDIYDFSIIPVEFISNVYEYFIGEEKQAEKGAYYTPKFLVDYMLAKTVGEYFKQHPLQHDCKVLDPACGSGIFLVEALRLIIEQYKELHGGEITPETLKKLAKDNIYGVDKDSNAINVAIFSIYLTLLDYQKPKDIEKFAFPRLTDADNACNIHTVDFFSAEKMNTLQKIKFDFIIGNPPWKRGALKNALFLKYIKDRKEQESNQKNETPITLSNKEIAQAFLLRTSDFSSQNTQCALIVSSKVLYNLQAKDFRSYFLHNYFISTVLELAPVASEVFTSAHAPAAILFFKYAHQKDTTHNELIYHCLKPNRFFSLFKILMLQTPDIKKVVQERLIAYDWLWKVLIYGSYLDFNFIKRLKHEYSSIENNIKDNRQLYGQGIIVGEKNKQYDVKKYRGRRLIDHKKDIEQYYVNPRRRWTEEIVTRERDMRLFQAPILLVKHGLKNAKAVAAVLRDDALYLHSLTGITGEIKTLRILCGLLNSDFFSYYMVNSSIVSIDRGRAWDEEKFSFPYKENVAIDKIVLKIEDIAHTLYATRKTPLNPNISKLKSKKQELTDALNDEIFKTFKLSEQERALVDYAVKITIPSIKKHQGYEKNIFSSIAFNDKLLEEYAQVFLARFEGSFKEKHLAVDVWHSKYIVGVFFKVTTNGSANEQSIQWIEKENNALLVKISSLGIKKPTEEIFIHKDIRGFEQEGLYIIKPNEKKLWHKAIAYLDVDEFMDAILKAGKKNYNG